MDERARKLSEAALSCNDYRSFLAAALDVLSSTQKRGKFSQAAFARKAGFKSRGFTKEVIAGRKRITSQSFPKFSKALQLPRLVATVFKLLVLHDEPDFNAEGLSTERIEKLLVEARERLRAELAVADRGDEVSQMVHGHRHVLAVYAVLGNRERGASFDDIVRRTGLQSALCRRVLDQLLSQNLAEAKGDRYVSLNAHLVFQGLGGDHPAKTAYLETVNDLRQVAAIGFSDPEKVFVQSYFSVDPKRLP
ncbi:MAG: hypothetical protein AAB250_01325, partial [Bdellovibrionota bacterium]